MVWRLFFCSMLLCLSPQVYGESVDSDLSVKETSMMRPALLTAAVAGVASYVMYRCRRGKTKTAVVNIEPEGFSGEQKRRTRYDEYLLKEQGIIHKSLLKLTTDLAAYLDEKAKDFLSSYKKAPISLLDYVNNVFNFLDEKEKYLERAGDDFKALMEGFTEKMAKELPSDIYDKERSSIRKSYLPLYSLHVRLPLEKVTKQKSTVTMLLPTIRDLAEDGAILSDTFISMVDDLLLPAQKMGVLFDQKEKQALVYKYLKGLDQSLLKIKERKNAITLIDKIGIDRNFSLLSQPQAAEATRIMNSIVPS